MSLRDARLSSVLRPIDLGVISSLGTFCSLRFKGDSCENPPNLEKSISAKLSLVYELFLRDAIRSLRRGFPISLFIKEIGLCPCP